MTIIDGLVADHRIFLTLFDEIEHALPDMKTVGEVALVCRLLAGLLKNHGAIEDDLAYITLDHMLHQQKRVNRLHHDHQELDGLLEEAGAIKDLPTARARLQAALEACRAHFAEEERHVFPLMEKTLQRETLVVLGKIWKSTVR
ncbi:MAG TPA: hemerythrin domain-containing protein [Verrucomicrobiae bacterium]|nr:hemerythrin domain-containing protein [Verrucomicrobiae bacterium]